MPTHVGYHDRGMGRTAWSWFTGSRPGWSDERFERELLSHRDFIFRVAYRMAGDATLAEDVAAAAIQRAWRKRQSFDGAYFKSWMVAILHRELANDRRKRANAPMEELQDDDAIQESFWQESEWRIAAERISEAMERLSPDHRVAIQLCDVEEMTYEEVAQALGVPIGTVRSRLFRARAVLRRMIGHAVEEAGSENR